MSIIPYQNVTSWASDPQTLAIYWGPLQAGDEGTPISVYAWPFFAWQFTGFSGNNLANPNVPIMADRSVRVLATNDKNCWGSVFEMVATPDGMNNRTGDPLRSGFPDGQFLQVKPVVKGSANPAGPDCGLILFCAKIFGPRT